MPSVKVSVTNLRLLTALKAMKLLDEHREIHRDEVLSELFRLLQAVITLIDKTKDPEVLHRFFPSYEHVSLIKHILKKAQEQRPAG